MARSNHLSAATYTSEPLPWPDVLCPVMVTRCRPVRVIAPLPLSSVNARLTASTERSR